MLQKFYKDLFNFGSTFRKHKKNFLKSNQFLKLIPALSKIYLL